MPESPRWLHATGQIDKTIRVLEDAARFNKITLPTNIDKILKQVNDDQSPDWGIKRQFNQFLK